MKKYQNKEWLLQHYVDEKLSMIQIAKLCECNRCTISKWIKKYDIPINMSESKKGKNNPAWNGGKTKRSGYIYILSRNHPFRNKRNYIAENRLVAEESLRKYCPDHPGLIEIDGVKYLRKDWISHHINKIKEDNRWNNLSVMPKKSHDSFHHLGKQTSEETKIKLSLYNQLRSSTSENNDLISNWGF